MEEIQFNHTLPIQLRFNDVDKFGHVNNTVYFSFYDLGKTEYFASVCPDVDWEKDGIVVVHIEANFLAQIYGSDHIAVQTAVTEIGTKSPNLASSCPPLVMVHSQAPPPPSSSSPMSPKRCSRQKEMPPHANPGVVSPGKPSTTT